MLGEVTQIIDNVLRGVGVPYSYVARDVIECLQKKGYHLVKDPVKVITPPDRNDPWQRTKVRVEIEIDDTAYFTEYSYDQAHAKEQEIKEVLDLKAAHRIFSHGVGQHLKLLK